MGLGPGGEILVAKPSVGAGCSVSLSFLLGAGAVFSDTCCSSESGWLLLAGTWVATKGGEAPVRPPGGIEWSEGFSSDDKARGAPIMDPPPLPGNDTANDLADPDRLKSTLMSRSRGASQWELALISLCLRFPSAAPGLQAALQFRPFQFPEVLGVISPAPRAPSAAVVRR